MLRGSARASALEPSGDVQILTHCEFTVARWNLEQGSHLSPLGWRQVCQQLAEQPETSGLRADDSQRDPHQGGLAGSVQSDETTQANRATPSPEITAVAATRA